MADYISREAAVEALRPYKIDPFKIGFLDDNIDGFNEGIDTAISELSVMPAADVRPVAEISDAVDEAIDFLTSVYDQMPYHVYSVLFDLIYGICPNCGANMTTKTGR